MTFEDYAWDCCDDMIYDCTEYEYVWCEITDTSCKQSTCPKLEEVVKWLKEQEQNVDTIM